MNSDTVKQGKSFRLSAKLLALMSVILLALSVVLPYATATEKYMARVERFEDDLEEATSLDAEDMEHMSMVEFIQFFRYVARDDKSMEGFDVFLAVVVAMFGVFILLMFVSVLKKKTTALIVYDILGFLVFCVENWIFTTMEIVPYSYNWGIGYYLVYVAAIGVLVAAFWMKAELSKEKKCLKAAEQSS